MFYLFRRHHTILNAKGPWNIGFSLVFQRSISSFFSKIGLDGSWEDELYKKKSWSLIEHFFTIKTFASFDNYVYVFSERAITYWAPGPLSSPSGYWEINDSSFDPVSSFWIWFRILHTWKLSFLQIDHSIVESFGEGGKACITARVYPKLAINNAAHLYVFNNGSEAVKIATLNAWSMKTAKVNWNTSKICRGWRSENGNWWQFDELLLQ